MKKIFVSVFFLAIFLIASQAWSDTPVFSANGFVCGKEGVTVSCKGPLPDGKGSVTGTGHEVIYLSVNTSQQGALARYTYFSDTGCLIGFTFNLQGKPFAAVASDRNGQKKQFNFEDGKYEKVIEYCSQGLTSKNPSTAKATETTEAKPATEGSSEKN